MYPYPDRPRARAASASRYWRTRVTRTRIFPSRPWCRYGCCARAARWIRRGRAGGSSGANRDACRTRGHLRDEAPVPQRPWRDTPLDEGGWGIALRRCKDPTWLCGNRQRRPWHNLHPSAPRRPDDHLPRSRERQAISMEQKRFDQVPADAGTAEERWCTARSERLPRNAVLAGTSWCEQLQGSDQQGRRRWPDDIPRARRTYELEAGREAWSHPLLQRRI